MNKPRFPPIPIPQDMLDPSQLSGYQPSPFDLRSKVNPGATFELGNPESRSVRASSEYISEWCVKILPAQETINRVAAGETEYGFSAKISVRHFGEQFLEYQPVLQPVQTPLEVPIFGQCIGVHGREIDFTVQRSFVGPVTAPKLVMQAAIVPGRPSLSFFSRQVTVVAGLATNNPVAIPTFATRVAFFGTLDAGDFIRFLTPASGAILTAPVSQLGQYVPLHPGSAFVSYSSAVGKSMAVGFEIFS